MAIDAIEGNVQLAIEEPRNVTLLEPSREGGGKQRSTKRGMGSGDRWNG